MLDKTLKSLEFHKLTEQLTTYASCTLGKEKARSLIPETDFDRVKQALHETEEAVQILRVKGYVPLGGIFDIRGSIKRAQIGAVLSAHELMEVASTIYASRQLLKFNDELQDEEVSLPFFSEYMERLQPPHHVEQEIKHAIDDNGHVMDGASDALRTIRHKLRSAESRIREKLDSIVRSSQAQKALSDAIVTIRNDRYVIPVKQEYRGVYGGIIHDQSSSGATLFIEPQAIVELNNQLSEAKAKEKEEIERILQQLSAKVGEHYEELAELIAVLAHIDFMFAKAKYAKAIKATKPQMNNDGFISLKRARHPLIDPKVVVANDVALGKDYTTIVITGPNTGGKTVTLKLVGMLTLMAQAGLHVPAEDGSELSVFDHIFADIGDEQSIEQSLSTFSSHMVNIVDILDDVDYRSLVLFDELGAGTDPQEGAALAMAILDEVFTRGARVIATTHYPELKAYGYNRPGVINASVEFDVETLSPTYRLLVGVPGRSNAFEISKRLGLQDRIITKARQHISAETNEVDAMIASLEEQRKLAEQEWQEAQSLRKESERIHRDLQKQMVEYYDKREQLEQQAAIEANKVVDKAREEADEIIQFLRELNAETLKDHQLIAAKKSLDDAAPKVKKKEVTVQQVQQLEAGDNVRVTTVGQKGTLIEQVSEKEWIVQIGILKMKVKTANLEYVSRPEQTETKPLATVKGRAYHVSMELDLRGERYEDAMLRVEKYIDDALLAGYPRISIIHGLGTGALRQGVQQLLKKHRHVKTYRFGEAGEGGLGVTIAELK